MRLDDWYRIHLRYQSSNRIQSHLPKRRLPFQVDGRESQGRFCTIGQRAYLQTSASIHEHSFRPFSPRASMNERQQNPFADRSRCTPQLSGREFQARLLPTKSRRSAIWLGIRLSTIQPPRNVGLGHSLRDKANAVMTNDVLSSREAKPRFQPEPRRHATRANLQHGWSWRALVAPLLDRFGCQYTHTVNPC